MEVSQTDRGKIIFIAFVGIQIPVLALTYYLWLSNVFFTEQLGISIGRSFGVISLLSIIFVADTIATGIVIYALYYLFADDSLKTDIKDIEDLAGIDLTNIEEEIATKDLTKGKRDSLIKHLIHYDTLTRLPNRKLFQTFVTQAIARTDRSQQLAIVVLDLNSLKSINSTLGRQVGDLLLTEVAQRLKTYLQEDDILARFGGDEPGNIYSRFSIVRSPCLINYSVVWPNHFPYMAKTYIAMPKLVLLLILLMELRSNSYSRMQIQLFIRQKLSS